MSLLQYRLLMSVNRVFILADKLYEMDIGAKHLLKNRRLIFHVVRKIIIIKQVMEFVNDLLNRYFEENNIRVR